MHRTRTTIVAVALAAIVIGAVAQGRHLLGGSTTASSSAGRSVTDAGLRPASAPTHPSAMDGSGATASSGSKVMSPGLPASNNSVTATGEKAGVKVAGPSGTNASVPPVPVSAFTPDIVHTATVTLRVGRGRLDSVLRTVTAVAGADGGYVNSSSVTGGTAHRSPVAGVIVFRVPATAFAGAIASLAELGTVEDQKITGKDVTVDVAQNGASITVLQDEVTLLEQKLAETTDLTSFLEVENQLLPVETQLQKLQAAQAVLENSAALATITVDMTAPGVPVVTTPAPAPRTDGATTAWRYLRHNTLAVLDGLAVGLGWALPVLLLLGLGGLVALRVLRRRRAAVTPA